MKSKDIRSSIIWLALGIILCVESYKLKIGSLHNPGPGLYPLGVAITLIVFSLIVLLPSVFSLKKHATTEEGGEFNKKKIILVIISLLIYAAILERLGFVFSTLLFIIFILKFIECKRWYVAISFAVLTAAISYAIFNLWLESNLPRGILGI